MLIYCLSAISNDPFGHLDPKKTTNPTRDYDLKIANFCKKKPKIKFIFCIKLFNLLDSLSI